MPPPFIVVIDYYDDPEELYFVLEFSVATILLSQPWDLHWP